MLIKNKCYTTRELLAMFGGNIQSSMPFVNGQVLYCKFDPRINPKFPKEAWIEIGPIRKKAAEYLIRSGVNLPLFKKIKSNQWEYLGKAWISDGSEKAALQGINKNPPRNKVQKILKFTF
jgi:hypothetical protein